MSSALQMYGRALDGFSGADPDFDVAAGPRIRFENGPLVPLAVGRYLGPADAADEQLLNGIAGPVLDVGCGPGRHLRALTRRGVFALGVDLSPVAVRLACIGGAQAIVGDIFDELPGAGKWQTALLLDGNVGIGGSPLRLLRRLRSLLHPEGRILIELEAPGTRSFQTRVRIEHSGELSEWLPWARVSASAIDDLAFDVDMSVERLWTCEERWFALLRPAG